MTDTRAYEAISADSHVLEPPDLFSSRLPASVRDRAPRLAAFEGGSAWFVEGSDPVTLPDTAVTGSAYRRHGAAPEGPVSFDDVLPALHDPAERIKAQVADSVDAEVLYPNPGLWDAIGLLDDAEVRLECVRAYNDWLADFVAHDPNRLVGVAKIPTTTPEDARAELVRAVEELGLKGAVLDAWPSGSAVSGNPDDDPFWEAVDRTGVPVSLHVAVGAGRSTRPPSGINPGLKPPMADAALPMVAAGVLDRFPNVRLVFAHGDAGWVFHWLEFMDINYVRHRHLSEYALADADALPSEYIRRHSWFTFHQDRSAVKNRRKLGNAHLMWASHFPFDDTDWPDDRQQAELVTAEVPADERRGLLAGNVAKLYRLPGSEDGFADAELRAFDELVHF
jgi:predicted TIM-barrel fold metal-dependent hydrolase